MNATEIIKLLDAGFSKDEIIKMGELPEEKPVEVTAEEPVEEVKEEKPEELFSIRAELDAKMNELTNAISDFTRRVQEANVLTARMSDEMVKQDTPEDIIARIINPKTKKEV